MRIATGERVGDHLEALGEACGQPVHRDAEQLEVASECTCGHAESHPPRESGCEPRDLLGHEGRGSERQEQGRGSCPPRVHHIEAEAGELEWVREVAGEAAVVLTRHHAVEAMRDRGARLTAQLVDDPGRVEALVGVEPERNRTGREGRSDVRIRATRRVHEGERLAHVEPAVDSTPGGPVEVGVLIPPEWLGAGYEAALAQVRAVDPRISVIAEPYAESHELRSARGTPGIPSERLGELRAQAPALTDAQLAALGRVQVVLAIDLPFDVATLAPRLRWVQAVGAGTAQLQTAGLGDAGIRLTSAAGVNAVGIAEFVIGRLLGHWKHVDALADAQRRHAWEPVYGRQLSGSTIGLIGLGEINAAVASRLQAFGVSIVATRRSATPGATAPGIDALYPPTELHQMLAGCDAVVAAVPETPETIGVMDGAAFAAMQPGAFFCNVGRGSFVDEPALIAALTSGHLGGAALDVASVEPLPADDPLWDAPNLVLSPHSAASPGAMFVNLFDRFADNLQRYLAGDALHHEVDVDRGY